MIGDYRRHRLGRGSAPGRARVIRKVSRLDAKKQPKVALDRRDQLQVERVRCAGTRMCEGCPSTIRRGEYYAKTSDLGRPDGVRLHGYRGGRVLPTTHDYHPWCVPDPYRPLLRLLNLPATPPEDPRRA